jgi:integrase
LPEALDWRARLRLRPRTTADRRLSIVRFSTNIRTFKRRHPKGIAMSSHLKLVVPSTEKRTVVTPRRQPNRELRTREYLTEDEVNSLMAAARENREGRRDATMILMTFRHGLRAAELVDLRWDQVDFAQATLAVRRLKNGTPATHQIKGDELRALRRLQRKAPKSPFMSRCAARRSQSRDSAG